MAGEKDSTNNAPKLQMSTNTLVTSYTIQTIYNFLIQYETLLFVYLYFLFIYLNIILHLCSGLDNTSNTQLTGCVLQLGMGRLVG